MEVDEGAKTPSRLRRPAVMSDVGRLAGVSHQTVSRVINGSPKVRPETRRRVIAAMRELGYRPNSVARALVTGRTNTLGVVSFDTTLYGPASTLFGIERAAHEAGYFMIVASLKALNRSSVSEAVERLRVQGVDGILVIAPHVEAADALRHAPTDVPLVAVEAGPVDVLPVVARRPVRGRRQRHPAPARSRARDRVAHLGAGATSSRPASASMAGGQRSRPRVPTRRRRCPATGAHAPATTSAGV